MVRVQRVACASGCLSGKLTCRQFAEQYSPFLSGAHDDAGIPFTCVIAINGGAVCGWIVCRFNHILDGIGQAPENAAGWQRIGHARLLQDLCFVPSQVGFDLRISGAYRFNVGLCKTNCRQRSRFDLFRGGNGRQPGQRGHGQCCARSSNASTTTAPDDPSMTGFKSMDEAASPSDSINLPT